jgi:hypothetical protein
MRPCAARRRTVTRAMRIALIALRSGQVVVVRRPRASLTASLHFPACWCGAEFRDHSQGPKLVRSFCCYLCTTRFRDEFCSFNFHCTTRFEFPSECLDYACEVDASYELIEKSGTVPARNRTVLLAISAAARASSIQISAPLFVLLQISEGIAYAAISNGLGPRNIMLSHPTNLAEDIVGSTESTLLYNIMFFEL